MSEELNNLTFDNTKITFSPNTNNIATSDELEASFLYQDKMGTNYSKSKNVVRAFNFVGISLILTAAAIKSGNIISNAFAAKLPKANDVTYSVESGTFKAEFVIENKGKYEVYYYLRVNEQEVLKEDCSEEKTYNVEYSHLQVNDECSFYIQYNNKIVEKYDFKMEV